MQQVLDVLCVKVRLVGTGSFDLRDQPRKRRRRGREEKEEKEESGSTTKSV